MSTTGPRESLIVELVRDDHRFRIIVEVSQATFAELDEKLLAVLQDWSDEIPEFELEDVLAIWQTLIDKRQEIETELDWFP